MKPLFITLLLAVGTIGAAPAHAQQGSSSRIAIPEPPASLRSLDVSVVPTRFGEIEEFNRHIQEANAVSRRVASARRLRAALGVAAGVGTAGLFVYAIELDQNPESGEITILEEIGFGTGLALGTLLTIGLIGSALFPDRSEFQEREAALASARRLFPEHVIPG